MRFLLLGPFEVVSCQPVSIPRRRERQFLAVLLLEQGRTVPVERLTELLWDGQPTTSARTTLRTHVSRLRAILDPDEVRIERQGRGYVLHTDPDRIDAIQFQTLVRQAYDLTGPERAELLRSALTLWRGPVLDDIATEPIRVQFGIRLEELWLDALDLRIEADLAAGRHRELVAELRELVATHPTQERFTAHLMLALYRCDRQADALWVYEEGRRALAEELGVGPGTDLRQLHERILHAVPALDLPASVDTPVEPTIPRPAPAQLPADVSGFTGRTTYLDQLDALLAEAQSSTAVVISAITGTGGVGKTALVVHWGHRVKARFPDGQLYVNLRGYGPEEPASPAEALAGFLRALGVDGRAIPEELADRAALFRTMMAGRRLLVIVDNAGSAEVVRPLLPGTAEAFVVITSRDALRGLAVRDGAHRTELTALTVDESRVLLETLIGQRVRDTLDSADALAARCARLPLALRLVADLAGRRPEASLADLAAELADEHRRLSLLAVTNDPYASIDSVLSWSYRTLSTPAARLFRLLGLIPGDDIDIKAATALVGSAPPFPELVDAHLVEQHSPGRFRLHDLLRAYARQKAEQQEPAEIRHTALEQLVEFYVKTCAAAVTERDMTWLETERPNLMAASRYAADHDQWRHANRLSETYRVFLDPRGYYDDARTLHEYALAGARTAGDQVVESQARNRLGLLNCLLGQYSRAEADFEASRKAAVRAGDLESEAEALNALGATYNRTGLYSRALTRHRDALTIGAAVANTNVLLYAHAGLGLALPRFGRHDEALAHFQQALENAAATQVHCAPESLIFHGMGLVCWRTGRYDVALAYQHRAVAAAQQAGSTYLEGQALNGLGYTCWRLGRYADASQHHKRALALGARNGNRDVESYAQNGLGRICARRGELDDAVEYHQQALALAKDTGNRDVESRALTGLAGAYQQLGHYTNALSRQQAALALTHHTGERAYEAEVLNGLAEIVARTGDPEHALEHLWSAVKIADEIGDKYELARAHHTIATIYEDQNRHREARDHTQRARDGYTLLGVPEADAVAAY